MASNIIKDWGDVSGLSDIFAEESLRRTPINKICFGEAFEGMIETTDSTFVVPLLSWFWETIV